MQTPAFRSIAPFVAVLGLTMIAGVATAQTQQIAAQGANGSSPPISVAPSFGPARFIAASTAVTLALSRLPDPSEGAVVVMLGTTDLTALFDRRANQLVYRSRALPLPSGEHEVVVYLATRDAWTEVARLPIKVLTPHGFAKSLVAPTAAMNNKGQLAQSPGVPASPTSRATFQDLQVATGVHSTQERDGWTFDGVANALGVTNRREALRFNQDSTNAPRYDLASYAVSLKHGVASLSLGDVTVGTNRYLANGFASRGIAATVGSPALSLSVGALGGSPQVGWDHPLGFTRPEHRVATASLNAELVPRLPGVLHLDVTWVNGSLLPQAGFARGALTDAERSTGAGFQLSAATPSQRMRIASGIAESRFVNPRDPLLAGDLTTTPVAPVTRTARFIEGNVVMLRDWHRGGFPAATVDAGVRREHVDPLYRSVAVGTQADVLANGATLNTIVGGLSVQSSLSRSIDNLAGVPSLMRTVTRTTTSQAALPLSALFRRATPGAVWPTLTYAVGRTGQLGTAVSDASPFTAADLPNLVATTHGAGAQWQAASWRASYRFDASVQDNRQAGHENVDQLARTHTVSLGRTVSQKLDVGFDGAVEAHTSRATGQHTHLERIGGAINWRPTTLTSVTTNLATTTSGDRPRTQHAGNTDARVELSQGLPFGRAADQSARAQAFLRYARQTMASLSFVDPVAAGLRQSSSLWTLASGLTLKLF